MDLDVSVQVDVDGRIIWNGTYVVKCSECGSAEGLRIRCGTYSPWDRGESADLVCREGHITRHSLVYPAFVRAYAEAVEDPGSPRDDNGQPVLAGHHWVPRSRIESDWDIDGLASMQYHVEYVPLDALPGQDPGWWRGLDPELSAAAGDMRMVYSPAELRP